MVTAARPSSPAIDFAHLKRQLPLARVLDQLGITGTLRGGGEQRRGPCPIHRGDGRGKTFSVHLGDNVFQCFDAKCARKGDVIDPPNAPGRLSSHLIRNAANCTSSNCVVYKPAP